MEGSLYTHIRKCLRAMTDASNKWPATIRPDSMKNDNDGRHEAYVKSDYTHAHAFICIQSSDLLGLKY